MTDGTANAVNTAANQTLSLRMPPMLTSDDAFLQRYDGSMGRRGRLFVVSGPSGVGKDTVLTRFHDLLPGLVQCVTVTTRAMRPGESQGNPYTFVSVTEFDARVRADLFLEYARVNGALYGTPREWVDEQRAIGKDVLLKIDVQGGLTVRTKMRDSILIFLMPPSVAELERRLRDRSTETEDQITMRLLDARSEMQQIPNYDYAVTNDTVERAAGLICAIVLAERARIRNEDGESGGGAAIISSVPRPGIR